MKEKTKKKNLVRTHGKVLRRAHFVASSTLEPPVDHLVQVIDILLALTGHEERGISFSRKRQKIRHPHRSLVLTTAHLVLGIDAAHEVRKNSRVRTFEEALNKQAASNNKS